MNKLLEAAKAIVDAEYSEVSATLCYVPAELLEALRQAVAEAEREKGLSEWVKFERSSKAVTDHIEDSLGMVYTPMTDDEILLKFDACDLRSRLTPYPHKTLMNLRYVERAIIESLGLRWPE